MQCSQRIHKGNYLSTLTNYSESNRHSPASALPTNSQQIQNNRGREDKVEKDGNAETGWWNTATKGNTFCKRKYTNYSPSNLRKIKLGDSPARSNREMYRWQPSLPYRRIPTGLSPQTRTRVGQRVTSTRQLKVPPPMHYLKGVMIQPLL